MLYIELAIKKSPAEVYEALTGANALTQWFAEHAHVSIDDNAYDFWGRHTPGTPDRDAGRHKLLEVTPGKGLAFEWPFWSDMSVVKMSLTPVEEGTRLALHHKNEPGRRREEIGASDFWMLSLQNLRSWLERGIVGPRPDFTETVGDSITMEVEIEASPAAVFEALVNPQQIDRYIGTGADVEPQVGGRYSYGWEDAQGEFDDGPIKILDITPNEKLSYSWRYAGEDTPETAVTWTLAGSGGRTRLTLVHSGFAKGRNNSDYHTGWMKYVVAIKNMVEEGPAWEIPLRDQQPA